MLTPQDIQEKKFEKATFGGYDMALVDDFLEQVCEDYTGLYKENAILKSKLKVLVEKVEEYRSTEDSMRMALLTAQKMAGELMEEAKTKGELIVAEAEEQAKRRSAVLHQQLAEEEARLAEAERRTSMFSTRVLDLFAEEKIFLERLGDLIIDAPQAAPAPSSAAMPTAPKRNIRPAAPIAPGELDKMESSVAAYLAQEVSRMTANPEADDDRSFEEGGAVPTAIPRDPFDDGAKSADEMEFLKMFDQDHAEEPMKRSGLQAAPIQPRDVRAEEKIDIARSISSALGDEDEIKVDTDAFWDDEGEPTTKRPKFEFDNLQFGKNLDDT